AGHRHPEQHHRRAGGRRRGGGLHVAHHGRGPPAGQRRHAQRALDLPDGWEHDRGAGRHAPQCHRQPQLPGDLQRGGRFRQDRRRQRFHEPGGRSRDPQHVRDLQRRARPAAARALLPGEQRQWQRAGAGVHLRSALELFARWVQHRGGLPRDEWRPDRQRADYLPTAGPRRSPDNLQRQHPAPRCGRRRNGQLHRCGSQYRHGDRWHDRGGVRKWLDGAVDLDRLLLAQCGFSAACTPGAGTPGLDTNGSVAPLFTFNGGFSGVHTVNQEMFSLIGEQLTPEPDPDSDVHGRFLGADQPVRHGGTLYQGTGGSMTVNKVMQVDRALFNAGAPLVSVSATSTINVATNVLESANLGRVQATLPSGDAMFKLNASTLNVLNGHLVSLSGSTFMSVVGDLLRLFNGSTASITNGGLVSVSGSSVFRLTGGSLAVFGGTGANALNVAGTTTLGGTLVT